MIILIIYKTEQESQHFMLYFTSVLKVKYTEIPGLYEPIGWILHINNLSLSVSQSHKS